MYMHHVICSLIYADLLFLVGLTSSVCVVSELIKKLERLRGGEKMADTDDFHDVWRTLCPVQEMEGGAGGLECRSGRSHIVQNYQKWSDGPDLYLQFFFKSDQELIVERWPGPDWNVVSNTCPFPGRCFGVLLYDCTTSHSIWANFRRCCICPYSGCTEFGLRDVLWFFFT